MNMYANGVDFQWVWGWAVYIDSFDAYIWFLFCGYSHAWLMGQIYDRLSEQIFLQNRNFHKVDILWEKHKNLRFIRFWAEFVVKKAQICVPFFK